MPSKTITTLIQDSLGKQASSRASFTIADIPYLARSFTLSDLNAKNIVFMPVIRQKFKPKDTESLFNKWMKLDSYPNYKESRLGDVDSGLLRKFNLGDESINVEMKVGPACYTDLNQCLQVYNKNSYVYVGVHVVENDLMVESSERGVVFPIRPKFLCVALIKTGI